MSYKSSFDGQRGRISAGTQKASLQVIADVPDPKPIATRPQGALQQLSSTKSGWRGHSKDIRKRTQSAVVVSMPCPPLAILQSSFETQPRAG